MTCKATGAHFTLTVIAFRHTGLTFIQSVQLSPVLWIVDKMGKDQFPEAPDLFLFFYFMMDILHIFVAVRIEFHAIQIRLGRETITTATTNLLPVVRYGLWDVPMNDAPET